MFAAWFRRQLPFVCAFALVAWVYVWTVRSNNLGFRFGEPQGDYYNLLVHGFLDGRLSLKADVAPALAAAPNPYDPAQRPSGVPVLHDASLYHGRYYIYYGVVPAVIALLPFRVLTGVDLPLPFAIIAFTLLSYVIALSLLADVRARFFPRCGGIMAFLIAVAWGFSSCAPLLLRRSSMYELPITCGGLCFVAALACAYAIVVRGWRPTWWLAGASLALGLAIGSRPTYILVPFVFAAVMCWTGWKGRAGIPLPASNRESRNDRRNAAIIFAAIGPIAVVGLLLAWYNYARFGNPTEFGVSYILSGVYESKVEHFRWRYFPWNAFAYFLSPTEWGRYFPFLHLRPVSLPLPKQHYGMDQPFGLLVNVPFVWLALFAWSRTRAVDTAVASRLRLWVGCVATSAIAVILVVFSFYAAMTRYLGDFAPAIALVGAVGGLALADCAGGAQAVWRRSILRVVLSGVVVATVFVVFLGSVQIYSRLRTFNRGTYDWLGRIANRPVHLAEAIAGSPRGALELQLEFPAGSAAHAREELVRTGWGTEIDRLLVAYPDSEHIRFVYEHAGAPAVETPPLAKPQRGELTIAMGSLFPPTTWAGYEHWTAGQVAAVTRRLELRFNGTVLLERYQRFYPGSAGTVVLGGKRTAEPFSGRISAVHRAAVVPPTIAESRAAGHAAADGTWHLSVVFPEGRAGLREPLIVSGETGRGDFIVVEYLDDHRLRFLLDHWGSGAHFSESVPYQPGNAYRLDVRHAAFAASPSGPANIPSDLEVTIDGTSVWRVPVALYSVSADDIYVGYNPIGGSACDERFSGRIEVH